MIEALAMTIFAGIGFVAAHVMMGRQDRRHRA